MYFYGAIIKGTYCVQHLKGYVLINVKENVPLDVVLIFHLKIKVGNRKCLLVVYSVKFNECKLFNGLFKVVVRVVNVPVLSQQLCCFLFTFVSSYI